MSGSVYCFATNVDYHPLKAWTAHAHGLNGFNAREGYHGIFVAETSRQFRDVLGTSLLIEFEIVDTRPYTTNRKYDVKLSYGGTRHIFERSYATPGRYTEVIPAMSEPEYVTLLLEMWNEHHQYFTDSFTLGFNVKFYRTIKWVLVLPFVLMALILVLIRSPKPTLPT